MQTSSALPPPAPAAPAFPTFRARAPWWGPDLQTLRNVLRPPRVRLPAERQRRLLLPLGDSSGDMLAALLDRPERPSDALVVLVHGLSGSEESAYMLASAAHWLARGHPVLRLNLRGAGPSRAHCSLQYHAGRSDDLRRALAALDPKLLEAGLLLVGYSLGGNMLLKFLAEHAAEFPLRAAASVSAPIDLAAASERFLAPRNRFYQRHLLRALKLECFGGRAEISAAERERVLAARSIYEFDDDFVAPRNDYRSAAHYYQENSAMHFLSAIRVPTLLVHALDDPWIPDRAYLSRSWTESPHVVPLLARGGGHVGFHARPGQATWHDRCIARFLESVTS